MEKQNQLKQIQQEKLTSKEETTSSVSSKKSRNKRQISASEKCRAVLSVWTESCSISEVCRDLSVTRAQVTRWQEIAMEAMLQALDRQVRKVKKTPLSNRLEKLLKEQKTKSPPQADTPAKQEKN